ncbi:hypothetical protein CO230_09540 [Chryseobacterium sp. 6424]|uniref:hypothetical protein n=1 Tax=Chryseobacterium sp. 6424 TaxID=2039166 RepID=UPI000EFBCA3C|nr:hypothetical protein [Chryseobacterium sp. 6424]AYO58338.1 hypothetical protein CO230_09540 [Chryseobacterium sp. 6424]
MRFIAFFIALSLISCDNKEKRAAAELAMHKKWEDSVNAERRKINERIAKKNNVNQFADLSGEHQLRFSSDNTVFSGKVHFDRSGKDRYTVVGKATSGSNYLIIEGEIKQVSHKHLNFMGDIRQSIDGKTYLRNKNTTFLNEGKGNFWRLQHKINGEGFVDYIDIYF